ncbi:ABC transporter ATP-binding protein [Candidatus Peregrinibacteria bacterium]|nr:MAG: ABC transporter ATP-binding protein [Candidatus Peregrinibacteria bacterium]
MIVLQNVTKNFGTKTAVKNLSLHVLKGEVFGFLGPNGAGKTTTMKMILGLLCPTKGTISLFGKSAGTIAAKQKIGFLPEFSHFYPHLTGEEFLHFVGEIFGLSPEERSQRAKRLLKLVHLPTEASHRAIGTYSKGMQQRIGMAQALMNDPEIIFLDEPMSGLDPIGRRELKDIIISLKKGGKTIFFNSHILADAEALCDRVGIIHQGNLLLDKPVSELIGNGITLEDVFVETITGKKKVSPEKEKPSRKNSSPKKTSSLSSESKEKKKKTSTLKAKKK